MTAIRKSLICLMSALFGSAVALTSIHGPSGSVPAFAQESSTSSPTSSGVASGSPTEPAPTTDDDAAVTEATPKPEPERVPEPPAELRIATWGGAYGEAQKKAIFGPFTSKFGIDIRTVSHAGGAKILQSTAKNPTGWDLADIPFHVAEEGCRKGLLEHIDPAGVRDANGASVDLGDFLPDAVRKCAIGTSVWSSVIAYDRKRFKKAQPARLEDFFDTKRFPGKRGLPMRPRYVLEMALMADGVAPAEVYPTLETHAGIARAFAKLETIRKDIVWWQSTREPATLLIDGKVAMAVGFNGRFYMATAARQMPVDYIWDGQIYDMDVWVIPKKSSHLPTAMKFLSFAVRPQIMATQASWLPYGPTRRSAAKMVDRHASLSVNMARYLPTAPDNFDRALRVDEAWWDVNNASLVETFRYWLDGKTSDTAGAAVPVRASVAPDR
ncbi:MAG: ABC transporter substrate-binding protein [Hyphomicrobiaceae bacterium]